VTDVTTVAVHCIQMYVMYAQVWNHVSCVYDSVVRSELPDELMCAQCTLTMYAKLENAAYTLHNSAESSSSDSDSTDSNDDSDDNNDDSDNDSESNNNSGNDNDDNNSIGEDNAQV
jgi:hypothetical protein